MRKKNKGQALLEFALTLPLLLIIIFGVFDLGRLFYVKIIVTNAAREGARYLAFNPDDKGPLGDFLGTKAVTQTEVNNSAVALAASDVQVTLCTDADSSGACDIGTPIEVTATSTIKLGLFGLFADTYSLSGTARMMVP